MRVRLLTAIALAVTLSACFSPKPIAQSPVTPPPSTGISESIFPHKSEWKDPAVHGVYVKDVLDLDPTSCLGCHGITDTVNGGAPSCRSCHKQFPHTEPGVTLATHGDYVIKNGKAACATTCHGTDLKGGLSGKPCAECHKTYPHDSGWATPSVHGPEASGDLKLKNKCNSCHGDDWKGGTSKVSCISCHKGSYPHPAGWGSPEQHGAFASTNGTGKCATQCHGVQLDGGLSGVSCKDGCHKVWPHPAAGWMVVHGQTARSLGLSSCTGCHKNDATGGKTGITCTKCHTSLPAHQDADWDKTGHGKLLKQQPASLTDPKGCPLCHGADLTGGKVPTLSNLKKVKGCNDSSCHATYPQLHTPAWKGYDGHAKWVLNQVDVTKKIKVIDQIDTLIADCKLCHGKDLKGGNSGKSCTVSGCHTSFPHNTDSATTPWLFKHGTAANAENPKAASCATVNCHGQKLEGSNFNGKKLVSACNDCHLQMPHQDAWTKTHGASASADPNTCVKCHGSNWAGSDTSPSCYTAGCHTNYPLPHRTVEGIKNPQWKPAIGTDFHGALVMKAAGATAKEKAITLKCMVCHDSGNPGNPTPSCYDSNCHASFPHGAATLINEKKQYIAFPDNSWKDYANGHGQYVELQATLKKISVAQEIKTECAGLCHGTDLKGGNSQKSCITCHHSNDASTWLNKDQHGAAAVNNIAACKGCHGPNLDDATLLTDKTKTCANCHNKDSASKVLLNSHKDVQTGTVNVCIEENDIEECIAWEDKPVYDYFVKNALYQVQVGKKWITVPTLHMGMAKQSLKSCQVCHGEDLQGGVSGKTCFVQGACHDPGNRYKDHPANKAQWLQQMAAKPPQVEYVMTLYNTNKSKYPPYTYKGMYNCWTACHSTLYPAIYGKNVLPDNGDCNSCHKGDKDPNLP